MYLGYTHLLYASMIPLLSDCRQSVHPSVRNGHIVDKRWVIEEKFLQE